MFVCTVRSYVLYITSSSGTTNRKDSVTFKETDEFDPSLMIDVRGGIKQPHEPLNTVR